MTSEQILRFVRLVGVNIANSTWSVSHDFCGYCEHTIQAVIALSSTSSGRIAGAVVGRIVRVGAIAAGIMFTLLEKSCQEAQLNYSGSITNQNAPKELPGKSARVRQQAMEVEEAIPARQIAAAPGINTPQWLDHKNLITESPFPDARNQRKT